MPRPFITATRRSRPRARASRGRSLSTSCSCRFLVPVETTTRRPSSTAGQEVGEGLAGAGAGLGQEQAAPPESALDRLGQPLLGGTLLVAGQHPGEQALVAEERLDGGAHLLMLTPSAAVAGPERVGDLAIGSQCSGQSSREQTHNPQLAGVNL